MNLFVHTDEWTGPRYRYGYRNRPFAMAHQPKGFIIGSLDGNFRDQERGVRHGTVEYPFQLTADEIYSFELVDLNILPVPQEVIAAHFGCNVCLYAGCECVGGSKYSVHIACDGSPSCGHYSYYD